MLDIPMDQLDSDEERHFVMWLEELRKKGLCQYRYKPRTFLLFKGSDHKIKYKSGAGITPRDVNYTPDFSISWDERLKGILFAIENSTDKKSVFHAYNINNHFSSVIDVKGSFAGKNNTSAVTFPLKQKWMLEKYHLYVQKIIPLVKKKAKSVIKVSGLFIDTFTPAAYLFTPTGKPRKLNYKPRMINKYLEENGIN